jgi:hypothetical protein
LQNEGELRQRDAIGLPTSLKEAGADNGKGDRRVATPADVAKIKGAAAGF